MRRDWKFCDHEATLTIFSDNRKFAPWGLFGGGDGAASKYILNPDGEAREQPSKGNLKLPPDSVISYRTPGGGGYGPPLDREAEQVLADVIDGKVTPERARDAYGVVVDVERREVDVEATAALRRKLRGQK